MLLRSSWAGHCPRVQDVLLLGMSGCSHVPVLQSRHCDQGPGVQETCRPIARARVAAIECVFRKSREILELGSIELDGA